MGKKIWIFIFSFSLLLSLSIISAQCIGQLPACSTYSDAENCRNSNCVWISGAQGSCTDTDGGLNLDVKGVIKGRAWSDNNNIVTKTDSCSAEGNEIKKCKTKKNPDCGVYEYTCVYSSASDKPYIGADVYPCGGYGCKKGVCKKSFLAFLFG